MLRKFIAVAALVTVSTVAFAKSTQIQVTLANPATQGETIASSIIFRCNGTSCVSTSDTSTTSDMSACRALYKAEGPIAGFTTSTGSFDEAKLDKCNGKR
jgi:hypothetical protein